MDTTDESDGRAVVRGETEQLTMLWHQQVEEAFRGRCVGGPRPARSPLRQLARGGARDRAVADVLWWAVHDGQKEAPRLEYAPLPAAVVRIEEATIRSLTSGGKALLTR